MHKPPEPMIAAHKHTYPAELRGLRSEGPGRVSVTSACPCGHVEVIAVGEEVKNKDQ